MIESSPKVNLTKNKTSNNKFNCKASSNFIKSGDAVKSHKRNLTLTVVSISFLFTIGTLPWAIYTIMSSLFKASNTGFLFGFGQFAISCLFFLIFFKIFIYYSFNRFYRQIFKIYLSKIISCCCFKCS